jgi:hypothetical protein
LRLLAGLPDDPLGALAVARDERGERIRRVDGVFDGAID